MANIEHYYNYYFGTKKKTPLVNTTDRTTLLHCMDYSLLERVKQILDTRAGQAECDGLYSLHAKEISEQELKQTLRNQLTQERRLSPLLLPSSPSVSYYSDTSYEAKLFDECFDAAVNALILEKDINGSPIYHVTNTFFHHTF